jgi:hypothetical protein
MPAINPRQSPWPTRNSILYTTPCDRDVPLRDKARMKAWPQSDAKTKHPRDPRAALLFDAPPMTHPHVLSAYRKITALLRRLNIRFQPIGGIAMHLAGAGRPTKDVDLVVSRQDWQRARRAGQQLATDPQGIRVGLPGEPEEGLALLGPHGVAIELWPDDLTHGEIARIRGKFRAHPAGDIQLGQGANDQVALVTSKLASHLSATDRLRDAADVQALIKTWDLPLDFDRQLDRRVRAAYRRIWRGEVH